MHTVRHVQGYEGHDLEPSSAVKKCGHACGHADMHADMYAGIHVSKFKLSLSCLNRILDSRAQSYIAVFVVVLESSIQVGKL